MVRVDNFVFEARDATFRDIWSNGAGAHNVRPPRSRTDHGADPTEVPLAHVQARHQGLRSLVWMQEEEEVGDSTGSHASSSLSTTWQVLEMDTQDMGEKSSTGNRYLLLVVDRASKFAFAYRLKTKDAESVAKKLLDLLLMFGIPRCIRRDPGTEFTAEVVQHLCRWLKVPIDFGLVDHARAQGAVERLWWWIHEALAEL